MTVLPTLSAQIALSDVASKRSGTSKSDDYRQYLQLPQANSGLLNNVIGELRVKWQEVKSEC